METGARQADLPDDFLRFKTATAPPLCSPCSGSATFATTMNPTTAVFEAGGVIEGTGALAVASGQSAQFVLISLMEPGDEMVPPARSTGPTHSSMSPPFRHRALG
jgi:O-acetylhomoserine/O-acetylserine sulfhydrylase-like pyridoxal-dependent enzyme